MIGVKRPAFKLGNPKPPKSAKKKKALKETKPLADPDDATIIANPYAEYMAQKPSELMKECVAPPVSPIADNDPSDLASCSMEPMGKAGLLDRTLAVTEVLEEGEIPSAQEMVKNLNYVKGNVLEFPPKLPHMMGFRYKLLLEKAHPKELVPGQPPSLTWLEEKYGHLIDKDFWYDRTVKLASTFMEVCEGDVFDMAMVDLEKAVGHLVPYTEEEKEYLRLMKNYEQSPVQIDGRPTLEFLRKHHSKPPKDRVHANITKAALEDALTRYVPDECCPIHEDVPMRCLNADDPCGALFFKCSKQDCSVFYTSNTSEDVRFQLGQEIHPTVHQGLFDGTLKCHCEYTPRMRMSQSEKNPGRVFLTCFKKQNPCCYFQWVHWKVRPVQGPMDAYVQKPKPYDRPILNDLRKQSSQQLVCTGLDRFKKDNVKMYPAKDPWGRPSPWKTSNDPWWYQKQSEATKLTNAINPNGGFKPSPGPFNNAADQFKNGLFVGDNSFASDFFDPPSCEFVGGRNF